MVALSQQMNPIDFPGHMIKGRTVNCWTDPNDISSISNDPLV